MELHGAAAAHAEIADLLLAAHPHHDAAAQPSLSPVVHLKTCRENGTDEVLSQIIRILLLYFLFRGARPLNYTQ